MSIAPAAAVARSAVETVVPRVIEPPAVAVSSSALTSHVAASPSSVIAPADVSVTYYFLALATALLTGWDVTGVILILGAVTVLYTLIGGIQAVVWTDVIQGVFLVGGGLLCILLILFGSDASPSQIFDAAWEGGKFEIGRWQWDATQNNQWLLIIGSVVVWLQAFCCNQHNVQR
mgnify:CR=1 FL=1